MRDFASRLSRLNHDYWNFRLSTCAERIDLSEYGIEHNRCIDPDLISRLAPDDSVLQNFLYNANITPKQTAANARRAAASSQKTSAHTTPALTVACIAMPTRLPPQHSQITRKSAFQAAVAQYSCADAGGVAPVFAHHVAQGAPLFPLVEAAVAQLPHRLRNLTPVVVTLLA